MTSPEYEGHSVTMSREPLSSRWRDQLGCLIGWHPPLHLDLDDFDPWTACRHCGTVVSFSKLTRAEKLWYKIEDLYGKTLCTLGSHDIGYWLQPLTIDDVFTSYDSPDFDHDDFVRGDCERCYA